MFEVKIPQQELYDPRTKRFSYTDPVEFEVEHSLLSLTKWEQKWGKPFLSKDKRTTEETLDYIRCMTLTKGIPKEVYSHIPVKIFNDVINYINETMTATTIREDPTMKKNIETVTSEIIYHWMFAQNIPIECQEWHLNHLLTQIKVCSIKNAPPDKKKKTPWKQFIATRNAQNEARKAAANSKG